MYMNKKDLIDFYIPNVSKNNVFCPDGLSHSGDSEFSKIMNDGHPDLLSHADYLKNVVYKELGTILFDKIIYV